MVPPLSQFCNLGHLLNLCQATIQRCEVHIHHHRFSRKLKLMLACHHHCLYHHCLFHRVHILCRRCIIYTTTNVQNIYLASINLATGRRNRIGITKMYFSTSSLFCVFFYSKLVNVIHYILSYIFEASVLLA